MPKKRFSAEQIVTQLRQIEVLKAQPYGNDSQKGFYSRRCAAGCT